MVIYKKIKKECNSFKKGPGSFGCGTDGMTTFQNEKDGTNYGKQSCLTGDRAMREIMDVSN